MKGTKTMKKMKKLASLVLALAMALTLAVPAMAYNITIEGTAASPTVGHTYNVYQIFTGELVEKDGKNVLSNIKYGANYHPDKEDGTAVNVGAKVPQADINAIADARAFAKSLIGGNKLEGTPIATLNSTNGWKAENLAAGYYLIVDVTESIPQGDALSAYIVQVVDDVTMAPKSTTVTFEKKVDDKNDSNNTEDAVVWQDSADHDIGDNVPFQLKATLGGEVDKYTTYKMIFHDTLSKGLSYNADAKVYLGEGEGRRDITGYFTPVVGDYSRENGTYITFTCADVKGAGATSGSVITIEYTAKLNNDAVIGSAGNPNTAYLEYSNKPDSDGTGRTPDDTVIVFTYKVVVNKTDENKQPLAGANFKLEKILADGSKVNIDRVAVTENTMFTFTGLDDGKYVLTETGTPPGYNTIKPVEFEVVAGHVTGLDSLSGNKVTGEVEIEFTPDKSAGSLTTDVVNQSGATLPETGGMGTTLFYALGAVLVIGAGVAMVTKKRMA